MGEPGNKNLSRKHSLFVDDLKQNQESHKVPKVVNEIIVQESEYTATCYGMSNCVEHGKMVREEGIPVLDKRIETMDHD